MSNIESLLVRVQPLSPADTVNDVSELLIQSDYRRFLCLPVVEDGRPIGCISRNHLQNIFMSRYGRELHGRKSVATVMNSSPLRVEIDQPLDEASRHITESIVFPITEDFIITRDGEYQGIGHVVDMLGVMQENLAHRNRELARAYEKLKASEAQLVQSEKMASLGQMVAGVAHEINTPLGYVKNNVNLARDLVSQVQVMLGAYDDLLARLSSGEAAEQEIEESLFALNDMRESFSAGFNPEDVSGLFEDTLYGVEQISEIVLNLKNFSRLDRAPVDNVDLNQCLDSALLIARNVIKHKAEVIKSYGTLPLVSCTPSQMNQVFLNLLTNAAQAIDDKGRILVKTVADGNFAHVFIEDTGRGIPEDQLGRIFEPFFTTKPIGQGTGLGLSIAYQIVRSHGGAIRVASKPGVGTRFCVSLPLKKPNKQG